MLVPVDLGFRSLVLVFFVFFTPIVTLIIRYKWRIATARTQEIVRLVAMAAEEEARVEHEAVVDYYVPVSVAVAARHSQCAVCYCPTTTRCSRCKAIRYCSGKCQIIHWRQGHKEMCRPPRVDPDENEESQKVYGNDSEIGGRWYAQPVVMATTSVNYSPLDCTNETNDDKVGPSAACKEADLTSKSLVEELASFIPTIITIDGLEEPLANEIASLEFTSLDISVNGSDESRTSEPSTTPSDICYGSVGLNGLGGDVHDDFVHSRFSGDGGRQSDSESHFRFSFNLSSHVSRNSSSQCPEPKIITSDSTNPAITGNVKPGNGTSFSEKIDNTPAVKSLLTLNSSLKSSSAKNPKLDVTDRMISDFKKHVGGVSLLDKSVGDASKVNKSLLLNPEKPASAGNIRSPELRLSKSERIRSLSSSAFDDHQSCKNSEFSVPSMSSSNVNSEIEGTLPNSSNGLKTSVRKVVQQFKVSKLGKQNPVALGSENTGKYNCKGTIFPYELFIKLYHWDKFGLRPSGLTNCGNSCYANTVLQCLAFTRPLTAYLLQGLHSKACSKKDWCFTCEFEGLILKAKEGISPLSPMRILSHLQSIGSHLGNGRQEDAHEFLRAENKDLKKTVLDVDRYAIDTMQSVCLREAGVNAKDPWAEETTLVGLIFGGYIRSKIKCMKCKGKSERHERMMDLTVEIQGDIGTLEEALGRFTATEILDGDNKYECSRCNSYERAKKKLTVVEAPNILTIALKRFQSGKFGKLNKPVQFPEFLNLAPYMSGSNDKSPIYKLYAVVVHLDVMNAAFSGHYVCYVRNIEGKWFKIDDSKVKPVELERVLSKGAYMLLYARCSPRAPSLIRNVVVPNDGKMRRTNRCPEPTTFRSGLNPTTVPGVFPSTLNSRVGNCGSAAFESSYLLDRNHYCRIPRVDSSSDNSTLFSCSDEGSCSTESTSRDSHSNDDLSDFTTSNLSSPLRVSEDSDGLSFPWRSSPIGMGPETSGYPRYNVDPDRGWKRDGFEEKTSVSILYSDTSEQCRNVTSRSCTKSSNNHSNSNYSSETDWEQLRWCNPSEMNSGVSCRRPSRDSIGQTFY
ncbi:hypothetical protein GIB67_018597 [Kingdonia uniflora]|uniref:ubiquitinyl hydrolase 1 n=1 Tax=Kingdonia uniflora TaxID=39325 RepID=A0A7J7L898_9MAGN|nr:hypothetical protein GIB67_018597 [Kingdonia uniflora]